MLFIEHKHALPPETSLIQRVVAASAAFLSLLFAAGCGPLAEPGAESGIQLDLAGASEQAELRRETRRLDLGTREAREALLAGWSIDETADPQTSFVWGMGEVSSLRAFWFEPEPFTMRFRCWAMVRPDEPQILTTVVNGVVAGETVLAGDFQTYEVPVPASAIRRGENRIELRYRYTVAPGPTDRRPLAVAWDWIAFGPHRPAPAPAFDTAASAVSFPFRSRLDYYLRVEPGSRLHWRGIQPWRAARIPRGSSLEVRVKWEDGAEERSFHFGEEDLDEAQEVDLGNPRASLARISFLADPGESRESGAGLTLVRPALRAAASAAAKTEPAPAAAAVPVPASERPNVLLYVIDTLRSDRLGVYGYEKAVSPNLDAFARDAVVFERAFAQSGWTKTSLVSILTGVSPLSHGVLERDHAVPPSLPTLPVLLQNLGYQTIGLNTNGTVGAEFGFDRGFDRYSALFFQDDVEFRAEYSDRPGAELVDWLGSRPAGRPFFAYLHTFDPHDPYQPRSPYRERFAPRLRTTLDTPRDETLAAAFERNPGLTDADVLHDFEKLYDAEIAYNDEQFGLLVRSLKEAGLYDSTLIVVVSDHGEEFLDHGHWGHGHTLYGELLRVPLLVKLPGQRFAGRRVDAVAQHIDIVPTVLAAVGAAPSHPVQGRNLLPFAAGAKDTDDPAVLSLLELDGSRVVSLIRGDLHLLRWERPRPEARLELYDLRQDARERHNRLLEDEVRVGYLLGQIRELERRYPRLSEAPKVHLDEGLEQRLRALGYIR